jgi:diadenosine tetraphosphatase ApaH/serine/threonine PP2A family protein phosphatase
MKPVAETIASLGTPMFMHTVGEGSSPSAVIARWRRDSAEVDVGASDIVRVAISLQDGQHVRQQMDNAALRADIKVGSVSVLHAWERTKGMIQGDADILQIFLRETFLEAASDGHFACLALFNSHDTELQAAAMQLFVTASRGDPDDSLLLESAVYRIAGRLRDHSAHDPSGPAHGGLAPAARRRVNE